MSENSGMLIHTILIEIDLQTGLPTGNVKPNVPEDPNYVPPTLNLEECPLTPS